MTPKETDKENKKTDKENKNELRAWLENEWFEKIDKIKESLGLHNTTELMRVLIQEKYKELFEKSSLESFIDSLKKLVK